MGDSSIACKLREAVTLKPHPDRSAVRQGSGIRVSPQEFVFVDRKTGKKRFVVKPRADGSLPLEETSSLLAMHCVLRSQTPADFGVMVAVSRGFMDRLARQARKLIKACSPELLPIQITLRQQEVLRGIFQNLRNKEIAAELNVSERTVKFHVAGLLEKFQVNTRLGLIERVSALISSEELANTVPPRRFPPQPVRPAAPAPRPTLVPLASGERRPRARMPA